MPTLRNLTLGKRLLQAKDVLISDTGLQDLSGFQPGALASLSINDNLGLQTIRMDNITGSLLIQANAWTVKIELPDLVRAGNFTTWNVSALEVPTLAQIDGTFACYNSYSETLSAPSLTTIGNTLALVNDYQMIAFEFPQLKATGNGI